MQLSVIENLLSSNAVLVINEPRKAKHGYVFPCRVHKYAAENGAIGNAKRALKTSGYETAFDLEEGQEGDCTVYVFDNE